MSPLCLLMFCLMGGVLALARAVPAGPAKASATYTTKYDNLDLDNILKNERLLKNYMDCIMGRGRCTPEGEELKRNIPDALNNGCSKCSEKQRAGSNKVIRFLIDKRPKLFNEFERKYDPKGLYRQQYRAEAAKVGIKV